MNRSYFSSGNINLSPCASNQFLAAVFPTGSYHGNQFKKLLLRHVNFTSHDALFKFILLIINLTNPHKLSLLQIQKRFVLLYFVKKIT